MRGEGVALMGYLDFRKGPKGRKDGFCQTVNMILKTFHFSLPKKIEIFTFESLPSIKTVLLCTFVA